MMDQSFECPVEMHEHKKRGEGKCDNGPISASRPSNDSSSGGGFDCNICLDLVQDPVVTFCGHLFCWPCIYRWINVQTCSPYRSEHCPWCPVCKAEVSERTLIPLYCGGQSNEALYKRASHSQSIPQRPASPSYGFHTLIAATTVAGSGSPGEQLYHRGYRHQMQSVYDDRGVYGLPLSGGSLAGATTGIFHSSASMFGEMIYARIFGNQTTLYGYPDSYHLSGLSNTRVRRRMVQMDRSLSRLSFFLLCCLVFCLLLF